MDTLVPATSAGFPSIEVGQVSFNFEEYIRNPIRLNFNNVHDSNKQRKPSIIVFITGMSASIRSLHDGKIDDVNYGLFVHAERISEEGFYLKFVNQIRENRIHSVQLSWIAVFP